VPASSLGGGFALIPWYLDTCVSSSIVDVVDRPADETVNCELEINVD
jgi:hypothetical protein